LEIHIPFLQAFLTKKFSSPSNRPTILGAKKASPPAFGSSSKSPILSVINLTAFSVVFLDPV